MESWRLLVSPADSGARNLATDQAVAEHVRDGASLPTLRFYTWRPAALSLGYGQPLAAVDVDLALQKGLDLVRRPTGGQAILHNDELTYAVMLPRTHALAGGGVLASYERLSAGFERGFATLGLNARQGNWKPDPSDAEGLLCFASPSTHELSADGVKLMGSAQTRLGGALLQHGSIPFTHDPRIHDVLRLPRPDTLHGLRNFLSRAPTVGALIEVLATGFTEALQVALTSGGLSADECGRRDELVRKRYACDAWLARR
ncbi:MAG: biotin/lipoate A/B protein ligase family protein [Chloroflexi bacterium]|nr:biotin/lipoate A/B protein ligase family protein [Chloroflexota bacterium]